MFLINLGLPFGSFYLCVHCSSCVSSILPHLLSSPSSIPLSLSPSRSFLFHPSQRKNSTEEISCSVEWFGSIASSSHLRYHPPSSSRELVRILYLSPTLTFSETSSLSVAWILSENLSKYPFYLYDIIIKYYMYYRSMHTVASFLIPYFLTLTSYKYSS